MWSLLVFLFPMVLGQMAPAMNVSTTGSGSQNPFNLLGSGTGPSTGSLSGNSMSANNGGCPQLQSNCDVNCLTIGSDGCVQCTCSGSVGPGSLTGGSTLSSSGTGNGNQTSVATSGQPFSLGGSGGVPPGMGNTSISGIMGGFGGVMGGSGTGSGMTGSGSLTGGSTLTSSGSNNTASSGIMGGFGGVMGGSGTGSGMTGSASLTGGSTLTSSGSNNTASGGVGNPFSMQSVSGSSVQTAGSMTNFMSGAAGSMSVGNGSLSSGSSLTGSGSYAQPAMNNNGCPPFPSNCGSTCATLDKSGCPICTCTTGSNNSSSSSSASSGPLSPVQSSAGASQNLNGCPVFTNDCTASCVSLNANGCPVCTCHDAGGSQSGQGQGQTFSTGHGSSANANGCPPFYSSCSPSCVSLDRLGCPICTCNGSGSSVSSNGGSGDLDHMTGSQMSPQVQGSAGNNNGCPSFPTNCRSDCVTLNSLGCPLCSCTTGSGNTSAPSTGILVDQYNHIHQGASQLANGCGRYPDSCPAECSTTDNNGCPLCTCAAPSTSGSGQGNQNQECPSVKANCDPACLTTDSFGCILCNGDCDEAHKSSSGSSSNNSSSGSTASTASPAQACSPFDANCPAHCASFDSKGCIVCTCSLTTRTISTTITTAPPAQTVCPAFDGASCRVECLAMDVKGCLICNCGTNPQPATTTTPHAPSTAVPATTARPMTAAPITTVLPSTVHQSTVAPLTTAAPITPGSGNANLCPPFDASCKVECAAIDAMGCLTCSCPTGSGHNTTGSTSSGPSIGGAGNKNGCPVFDTSCPAGCAAIDVMGCLSCTCTGTTSAPGSGSSGSGAAGTGSGSAGTGSGNANSCPPVDIMACVPSCLIRGQHGCVICSCAGSTASVQPTTATPYTTVHPVKEITMRTNTPLGILPTTKPIRTCPQFDATCPAQCTSVDSNGCPQCSCAGLTTPQTTVKTTVATTAIPTTPSTTRSPDVTSAVPRTTLPPGVCPPMRCVYPCDAGVSLGADNCPVCKCRSVTTPSS